MPTTERERERVEEMAQVLVPQRLQPVQFDSCLAPVDTVAYLAFGELVEVARHPSRRSGHAM